MSLDCLLRVVALAFPAVPLSPECIALVISHIKQILIHCRRSLTLWAVARAQEVHCSNGGRGWHGAQRARLISSY